MFSVNKLLVVAVTALIGAAAQATPDPSRPSDFKAHAVIASHEAAPSLTAVVHHPRHRHHHRAKHRARPVRHVG